jgi:hypothetical protein
MHVFSIVYDYCIAVKLFSILMNLGKIVLQVGCSDNIIQPISSTFIHHSCINIAEQKHLC